MRGIIRIKQNETTNFILRIADCVGNAPINVLQQWIIPDFFQSWTRHNSFEKNNLLISVLLDNKAKIYWSTCPYESLMRDQESIFLFVSLFGFLRFYTLERTLLPHEWDFFFRFFYCVLIHTYCVRLYILLLIFAKPADFGTCPRLSTSYTVRLQPQQDVNVHVSFSTAGSNMLSMLRF